MNEEEKQELEQLRREKRVRQQTERERTALAAAGVPETFAPLLTGEDDGDTDRRAQDFCAAYQQALSQDIRQRLPERAPVVTPPAAPRPRRGIQRLR